MNILCLLFCYQARAHIPCECMYIDIDPNNIIILHYDWGLQPHSLWGYPWEIHQCTYIYTLVHYDVLLE